MKKLMYSASALLLMSNVCFASGFDFNDQLLSQPDIIHNLKSDFAGKGNDLAVWKHKQDEGYRYLGVSLSDEKVYELADHVNDNWDLISGSDFDGNGSSDYLWHDTQENEYKIWLTNKPKKDIKVNLNPCIEGYTENKQINGTKSLLACKHNPEFRGVGDFNFDGMADLVFISKGNTTHKVYVLLIDASDSEDPIIDEYSYNHNPVWDVTGIGDFDGDGVSDVLYEHESNGQVVIWTMNADGTKKDSALVATHDEPWQVVGIGDFDANDGNGSGYRDDILWKLDIENSVKNDYRAWYMDEGGVTKTEVALGQIANNVKHVGYFDDNSNKAGIYWHAWCVSPNNPLKSCTGVSMDVVNWEEGLDNPLWGSENAEKLSDVNKLFTPVVLK